MCIIIKNKYIHLLYSSILFKVLNSILFSPEIPVYFVPIQKKEQAKISFILLRISFFSGNFALIRLERSSFILSVLF